MHEERAELVGARRLRRRVEGRRHVEMGSDGNLASVRWHRLVTCRLEETERLSPGLGSLSGAFWDRRAERHAASTYVTHTAGDPFLRRLRPRRTHRARRSMSAPARAGSRCLSRRA